MRNNPVFKRESTVRARSFRMPLIILIFNLILAVAALLNMYETVARVRISASIEYSSFLQLYAFVTSLEFLLLMFIMPALTSGSISGERERQTLELLFTTKMTSGDIVMGKLLSACGQLLLLVISSLPVLLVTFVYGSINFRDLFLLLVCFVTVALFTGSIGMLFSSMLRRSTFSNACTYGLLLIITAGTYMLNVFMLSMSQMQINNMAVQPGDVRPVADTGAAVYLLLLNPVTTFAEILGGQVTGGAGNFAVRQFFGNNTGNPVASCWIPISLAVQLAVSALMIRAAIYFLNPVKNEKR